MTATLRLLDKAWNKLDAANGSARMSAMERRNAKGTFYCAASLVLADLFDCDISDSERSERVADMGKEIDEFIKSQSPERIKKL